MRRPDEILGEDLGMRNVDGYEIDMVEAGMSECHAVLSKAADALQLAYVNLQPDAIVAKTSVNRALAEVEQALAEIEG